MTSHGRSEPGKDKRRSEHSLAMLASSGFAKRTKPHWRPGSQSGFANASSMWPYLENSARKSRSVTFPGMEPTKILLVLEPPLPGTPFAAIEEDGAEPAT
eukprot:CAMPEP_0115610292 /NCGR_PEP_ID=MMETSP0272-20121206/19949_1 /TAXON_ID=71861 /ORGANISM="Scrippsiella trochoidea, Strain CCMP3099" /LENGTH=99 /DNA_ID=CAMNT_0003046003 /DNA_START=291 /DNA_END=590 /DNA_ORIENTATION=+